MQPSKRAIPIVVGLVLIGIGAYVLSDSSPDTQPTMNNSTSKRTDQDSKQKMDLDQTTDQRQTMFSVDQVAEHDDSDDCWTIINDSVYDITSYIARHPGGSDIELACGEDATSLFTQRTTNDGEEIGSGSPHSSNANSQLERLKIGELTN